jgi:hypothetical protein
VVGIFSYMLTKIDVSAVTIALGLVLGALMEESFQQASLVGNVDFGSTWLYFANRPLALVLMIVAFGIMAVGVSQILRERRAAENEETERGVLGRGSINLRTANVILGAVLIVLAGYIIYGAQAFTPEGAQFPNLVGGAFAVFGSILLAANLHPRTAASQMQIQPFATVPWRIWTIVVGALTLFAIAIDQIGFYEAAFIFLFVITWLLSVNVESPQRRLVGATVFAAIFVTLVFIAFKLILKIPTPVGLIV